MASESTCKKCGEQHYNFQECRPRADLKPPVEWKTGDDWGNQMQDLKHLGGNTYVQRREFDR
jgi:hypothetical protein